MKSFDLDRLRKKDFTRFIKTPITNTGDKRRTTCPFHVEKTASFFIYPNNFYYCFGCGVYGNAIDFVMKTFDYSFLDACNFLESL